MKNKYLTKYLCITMISAMVITSSAPVLGEDAASLFDSGSGGDASEFVSQEDSAPTGTPAQTTPETAPEEGMMEDIDPAPTQAPVDTPVETPTQAPTDTPIQTPTNTPTQAPTDAPTSTPTQAPTSTPTQAPANTPTQAPTSTPTQAPVNTPTQPPISTPTQAPANTPTQAPTDTPIQTPVDTPVPEKTNEEKVWELVDRIEALSFGEITLESRKEIESIRREYDALPVPYQEMVMNYQLFVNMEKALKELEASNGLFNSEEGEDSGALSDGHDGALEGMPLYYTDMVSNLHAGKEFYLNSLQENYQLSFSQDFAQVMTEIESEYRQAHGLSETESEGQLIRNWQDILAVYIYRQSQEGKESYTLDASCKEELAAVFEEMNPLMEEESGSGEMVPANDHINDYIKKNGIEKEDRTVLKKYTETDCKLLCAVVTGAKGFVRQSVGDEVSEERVNVITAAYSLIGEVGYFWGGKSLAMGKDPNWGSIMPVTAEGSRSTGTLRAFGLDCSGFVTWAVANGYGDPAMGGRVGNGTSDQWMRANVVSEADAQPGDLVFQSGPEAGHNNHVGILCGKTDAGDWIAVHCSSGQNGVTVGEAYGAGFRYIRQPSFYQTGLELTALEEAPVADSADTGIVSVVTVNNTLQDLFTSGGAFDSAPGQEEASEEVQAVPSGVTVNNTIFDLLSGSQEAETAPVQGPASVRTPETARVVPSNVTVNNTIFDLISSQEEIFSSSWRESSQSEIPSQSVVSSQGEVFSQGDLFLDGGARAALGQAAPGKVIQVNNALQGLVDAGYNIFSD